MRGQSVDWASIAVQVSLKPSRTNLPMAKTIRTMMAAMAATSRPYSTAEAPFSSSRRLNETLDELKHWYLPRC